MVLILNAAWTADVVGRMHRYRITNIELADRCVYKITDDGEKKSYSPQYISAILNGKKGFESEDAALKTKRRILSALDELILERLEELENGSDDSGSDEN